MGTSPIAERAFDLWRASNGRATASEIVRALDAEGMTATQPIVRAWKHRYGWDRAARCSKPEKRARGDGKPLTIAKAAKESADQAVRLSADMLARDRIAAEPHVDKRRKPAPEPPPPPVSHVPAEEDDEDAYRTGTMEPSARLESMVRSLNLMVTAAQRKFKTTLPDVEINTPEDALMLARAASILADSSTRMVQALAEVNRPAVGNRVKAMGRVLDATALPANDPEPAMQQEPMQPMKDITPAPVEEPPPRLSGAIAAFRAR